MTWDQIYKTSSKTQKRGLNWEIIENQVTLSGKKNASIRISKKFVPVFAVMEILCGLFHFIQITIVLMMKVAESLYNFRNIAKVSGNSSQNNASE